MGKTMYIYVLDRGFIVVGEGEISKEIAFTWNVRGATIRRWGTTEGLAQLQDGPLTDTILDKVCDRQIPFRSEIERICLTKEGEKAWKKALGI